MAEQNVRFDAALTNIPHGVCMFDAEKRLILCNAGYSALYSLPIELTLAGTPLQAILDHRAANGSAPIEMATYFDVADEAQGCGTGKKHKGRTAGRPHSAHRP